MSIHERGIEEATLLLQAIAGDTSVPRNIRRAASESIKILQTKSLSHGVRASNTISILDEIFNDPNMPMHTRVQLYQIASILEKIKD